MSVPEPSISIDEQSDGFVRVNMTYPQDFIIELARRAEENICEEVLTRLGYVKVVRCRECKQADIDQTEHEYREPLRCCLFHMNVKPDNFCCWACKEDK